MEMIRVDTQRAYELLWQKITTLELPPGSAINDQQLAIQLDLSVTAVREALKLLVHDGLVFITPRHGMYVVDINLPDLEQLSEMRLALETLCARMAAERAAPDDVAVLDALRREAAALHQQESLSTADKQRLFEIDHKFHQAIARAAHNKYMVEVLERFFGLSQRLWYLAIPHLGFLSSAVEEHLDLVEAIKAGNPDRAAEIMHHHVKDFYDKVQEILKSQ